MPRSRKLLLTTLVVGATSAVAGLGVFAAFVATTDNLGNSINAGSVVLTDSDVNQALFTVAAAGPGAPTVRCIKVTYGGTLPARVRLYASPGITNGKFFTLLVERGTGLTGTNGTCTGFNTPATVYTGDLGPTAGVGGLPTSWAAPAPDARGGASWNGGDIVDYRFSLAVKDDPTVNTHNAVSGSGNFDFTWEAQSN